MPIIVMARNMTNTIPATLCFCLSVLFVIDSKLVAQLCGVVFCSSTYYQFDGNFMGEPTAFSVNALGPDWLYALLA